MVFTRSSVNIHQPTILLGVSLDTETPTINTVTQSFRNSNDDYIECSSPQSQLKQSSEPFSSKISGDRELSHTEALDKLEKEIFDSSDSSDDEEFSFAKKGRDQATANLVEDHSMFVIDRAADDKVVDTPAPHKPNGSEPIKDQDHSTLIKELSKAPTAIHIEETEADRKTGVKKSMDSEIMKKAVISADFEKRHTVPTYSEGKKAMARKRREEKATTKTEWFNMKAPEMTEELEADLEAVQMRGSAASWTGYKKNDYKNGPRFFQIATVEDSPLDFYHSRIAKKNRKRTIVDELLADADFRKNNKKTYVKAVEKLNKRHPNKKGGRRKKKSAR